MKIRNAVITMALAATTMTCAFAQAGSFSDKDKSFLKDSTEDNLSEIKMAELVIRTTKNPEIKAFAEKMVTDHKALIAGAKPIAMKAGVTPPTTPSVAGEASYLKLKVLTGDTFDKSYVKTMVSDHHSDLDKVKAENTETKNADMKTMTMHAANVIGKHTKMIDAIAGKMGVS